MAMFLTEEELFSLTHKQRPKAQMKALRSMGIDHRERPDGTVAVLRSAVEASMGGETAVQKNKAYEPDWNAFNATITSP